MQSHSGQEQLPTLLDIERRTQESNPRSPSSSLLPIFPQPDQPLFIPEHLLSQKGTSQISSHRCSTANIYLSTQTSSTSSTSSKKCQPQGTGQKNSSVYLQEQRTDAELKCSVLSGQTSNSTSCLLSDVLQTVSAYIGQLSGLNGSSHQQPYN